MIKEQITRLPSPLLLHTPTPPSSAFAGEDDSSFLGVLWLAYPSGFLKMYILWEEIIGFWSPAQW